jgi:hypothetical protein
MLADVHLSDPAHPLTLWLARASMACYAVAVLIAASRSASSPRSFQLWRVAWSTACLLLIVHVLSAFHFEHGWSHAAALRHTAEQTAGVTGIDWGGGLYFNYAFLILWLADVAVLWRSDSIQQSTGRQSNLRRITNLACVFTVVNATVVFGPSWWIWPLALVGTLLFVVRQRVRTGPLPNK